MRFEGFKRTMSWLSDKRVAAIVAPVTLTLSISVGVFYLQSKEAMNSSGMPPVNAVKVQAGHSKFKEVFYTEAYRIVDAAAFSPKDSVETLVRNGDLVELPSPMFKKARWQVKHGKIASLTGVPGDFCEWINVGSKPKDYWMNKAGAQCYKSGGSLVASYQDKAFGEEDEVGVVLEVKAEVSGGASRLAIGLREDSESCKASERMHASATIRVNNINRSASYCLGGFYFENTSQSLGSFYMNDKKTLKFNLGGHQYKVGVSL